MPEPLSEPLFGSAVSLIRLLDGMPDGLTLEELRIVESWCQREIRVRRAAVALSMRNRGCSWGEVGAGLGISAQAAHKQFAQEEQQRVRQELQQASGHL